MKKALKYQGRAAAWLVGSALLVPSLAACGTDPGTGATVAIDYATPTPQPVFVFGAGGDSSPPAVVAAYGLPTAAPTPTPTPPPPPPPPPPPQPARTAPPPPPPPPQVYATSSSCPEVISSALGQAGCMISYCESNWNPNTTGAEGERGYFQIHPRWHPDSTYDPAGNVAAAVRISGGGANWSAWTTASVLSTGYCPGGRPYPG
ncbi:MAG: hypothetical protein M0R74_00010 [Dehalococcoidia bacterium]|nr:hypothetical protein [Dehalococcoidia bacterium]